MIGERELRTFSAEGLRLRELYKQKEHAHLLNEVDALSKKGSVSPDVMGLAALSLAALERWQEAAQAAAKAAAARPDGAWLQAVLALTEAESGNLEAALAAQQRARQLAPGDPLHAALLARYLRRLGRPQDACRVAREALVLDQEHPAALNELGLALAASGDPGGALEQFQHAQAAVPTDGEAWLNEGLLHKARGDKKAARRALHGALDRQPGWYEAEDALALTLPGAGVLGGRLLAHMLTLGRVTLVGWLMIAFLYYLLFRLLEFGWKAAPVLLPAGQSLLMLTLAYLLGGLAGGRLLRSLMDRGWPR